MLNGIARIAGQQQFVEGTLQQHRGVLALPPVTAIRSKCTGKNGGQRQAAGPLTENLPNVCACDRLPVGASQEIPSILRKKKPSLVARAGAAGFLCKILLREPVSEEDTEGTPC